MLQSLPVGRRLRKVFRLPAARRAPLVEAVAWLFVARMALLIFPFRSIAARLGVLSTPESRSTIAITPASPELQHHIREVSWAVTRAACNVPFRAVCLPQAIAAKAMLRRRHVESVLHFGLAKGTERPLDAHAWLDAAGIAVTGSPVAREFTEIACFV